jgi:hypothetical protein
MIPALTIAVAGLVDASQRLNAAASSTVQKGALAAADQARGLASYLDAGQAKALKPGGPNEKAGAKASGTQSSGSAGRSSTSTLAQFTGASAVGTPLYVPSFAEDALALRTAAAAYKANAAVVRTLDDLSQSLTEAFGNQEEKRS